MLEDCNEHKKLNVALQDIKKFMILNYKTDLQTLYDFCLQKGITNDLIAKGINEEFPDITADEVSVYLEANGFDSTALGTFDEKTDLSEEEFLLFDDMKAKMISDIELIKNRDCTIKDNMLIVNKLGKKNPIYWCFNSWAEPLIFSKKINENQPLYAMHSFNKYANNVIYKTRLRLDKHLALHYLNFIKNSSSPIVFIGNCQGASLVESMAIHFQEKFDISPLLITLDYIPERYYTGPYLMLYGRESSFNPFNNPKIDFLEICNSKLDNFSWGFLDANHGEYFFNPTIDHIYSYIKKATKMTTLKEKFQNKEMMLEKEIR